MSAENVARFLKLLDTDKTVQQEYLTATRRAAQAAVRSAVTEMASNHGCTFTEEELAVHLDRAAYELSDEELDAVAGGAIPEPIPTPASFSSSLVGLFQRSEPSLVGDIPGPLPRTLRGT